MRLLFIVVLSGVLAAASPGVLERVEITRLQFGGVLAGPGVIRLAVEDCAYLGRRGVMLVERRGVYRVHVTDCQADADRLARPLHSLGLVADVDRQELNGKRAVIILWGGNDETR